MPLSIFLGTMATNLRPEQPHSEGSCSRKLQDAPVDELTLGHASGRTPDTSPRPLGVGNL